MKAYRTGPKYPVEDIVRRGEDIYARLRPTVETDENMGKLMMIDIESEDCEIGEDRIKLGDTLRTRHDDPEMYTVRIGYPAVEAIGYPLLPTK